MDKIVLNDKIIEGLDVENPLDITTIMIEDTVEEIADNAFENLYNLHSIFISDNSNLKRIGKSACKNCFNLVNLKLDVCSELEVIEDEAFNHCTSLPIVRLPNSVKRIGKKAFSESGISNCRLSSSLEEIDEEAFADSTSLRFIIIPSGVKVSNDAFSGTDTEVIQIEKDKIIDMNSIIPNNVADSIENKENVITINQEGKILSVPVRDDSFYIASHEFGVEYIAAKYLNTFIEDKPMNWKLSNSLATIFMVDSYQDIFDILGFPNDLSANQIRVIKDILETHKENQLFGVLEIIDGHVRRSCDDEERTAKEFLENFDSIITNGCNIKYLEKIKSESKGK
jgi:hypothetical protein